MQNSTDKRPACSGLWHTPMVHVNGDVTTCCLDEHLENRIGNITRSSLEELWNSNLMNQWRIAQIQGRFDQSGPLCSRCNWRSAGAYSEQDAMLWYQRLQAQQKISKKQKIHGLLAMVQDKLQAIVQILP